MQNQTLTLEIPNSLYVSLKKRAERANRSVEDETVDLLATSVPQTEGSRQELQAKLESLKLLNNEDLAQAARGKLSCEQTDELELLHLKQQREGLNEPENSRRLELMAAYEHAMLIRAQAAALMKERGLDITNLVAPQ